MEMRSHNKPFASSAGALLAMGIAFLLLVITTISAALLSATGAFAGSQNVTAGVIATGSQIRPGAPVKFREVTVGKVEAVLTPGNATVKVSELSLTIDRDHMTAIPSNVTARIAPSSLFGENVLELVPPKVAAGATLQPAAAIPADPSSEAVQMATMFEALKHLVEVMQPAKLQSVLGTLAQVLDGRGPQLGEMTRRLNGQLAMVAADMPLIRADVIALTNVIDGLTAATPDLLSAVRDTVVVSQDILERRDKLSTLISNAGALAADTNEFLLANRSNLSCAISIGAGLFEVLRDNLATYGSGLTNGIKSTENFIKTFNKGPWGGVSVEVSSTLTKGIVAPSYRPEDRTRFPGQPGPTCSGVGR